MASLSFSYPPPFLRVHSSDSEHNIIQYNGVRFKKWCILAVSKKKVSQLDQQDSSMVESGEDSPKKVQRARRRKKMITDETLEKSSMDMAGSAKDMIEASEKPTSRGRKKDNTSPSPEEGSTEKKVIKRKSRRKAVVSVDQRMEPSELSDVKELITSASVEDDLEKDETLLGDDDDGEDISFTYSWPPLVCCFGAAQHSFVPSGRPANRLINHEIHKSMKDMFWTPTKFVRAPGSSPSSVAIAHASIGGRVAFMGKLGDDEYGGTILYHLNVNKVQTRAIKIDRSRPTSLSQMKIYKRSGLKATCVKPCAEDSFFSSEINIDILKEVLNLFAWGD